MKPIYDHIREKLHNRLKLEDFPNTHNEEFKLDRLSKTEWSDIFEKGMRDRLLMGAFRYGKITHGKPSGLDRILDIKRRVKAYEKTGNAEYLFDIANAALLEFVEDNNPDKFYKYIDDGEIHCIGDKTNYNFKSNF